LSAKIPQPYKGLTQKKQAYNCKEDESETPPGAHRISKPKDPTPKTLLFPACWARTAQDIHLDESLGAW